MEDRVDKLPALIGLVILTVGTALMYTFISDGGIIYYNCYGVYDVLLILADRAFLSSAHFPVPKGQSEQHV